MRGYMGGVAVPMGMAPNSPAPFLWEWWLSLGECLPTGCRPGVVA